MEHRLHRLKERFLGTPDVGWGSRMEKLEESFQRFQAETNMKLAIIYEILALNCERMNRSKSELQREHDCETLLESWNNVGDLAANGLSLRILRDINNDMELLEIPIDYGKEDEIKSTPNSHADVPNNTIRRGASMSSVSSLRTDAANSECTLNRKDSLLGKSRSKNSKSNIKEPKSGKGRKRKPMATEESSESSVKSRMKHDSPPKLLKSEVLNYFEIRNVEGWARARGICKLCNRAVSSEIQRLRNHVGKCSGRHKIIQDTEIEMA